MQEPVVIPEHLLKYYLKIRYFSTYQERCHNEVREKLFSYKLPSSDVSFLESALVNEEILDEERFAKTYVRGKFRQKNWGRVKIRHHLVLKKVSKWCIQNAFKEIIEEDYLETAKRLAEIKRKQLKPDLQLYMQNGKITNYLLQKGFEPNIIRMALETTPDN